MSEEVVETGGCEQDVDREPTQLGEADEHIDSPTQDSSWQDFLYVLDKTSWT